MCCVRPISVCSRVCDKPLSVLVPVRNHETERGIEEEKQEEVRGRERGCARACVRVGVGEGRDKPEVKGGAGSEGDN